jgi:copper chaperone CopZ
MPTVKLSVRGLTAGNEADLERALRAIEGVFGAVASRAGGCCEIDFEDDVVAIDELLDAARRAGFDATLAG